MEAAKIYLKYDARYICVLIFFSPLVFTVCQSKTSQEFSEIQSLIGTEMLVLPLQIRRPICAGNVLCMELSLSSMLPCELPQSWQLKKTTITTNVARGTVDSIIHVCLLRCL